MSVEFLIDGYNLLHHAGLGARRFGPGEFERARDQLLKRLARGLDEEERCRTTIVFDAQYAERGDRRPLCLHGMQVLFSPRGRQADDLIEILLASHQSPAQVLVISSDHRLQRAARAARAGYIDSDGFLVELAERQEVEELRHAAHRSEESTQDDAPSSPVPGSGPDIGEWLTEFADIDVSAISREVDREIRKPQKKVEPRTLPKSSPADTTGASQSKPGKPSAANQCTSPQADPPNAERGESIETGELSFWEQRIAELLRDETNRPPNRTRH